MQKNLAKIKIDFFDLFGVGGSVRRCLTFFFFLPVYLFEKKNIFYRVKFGSFLRVWGKSALLAGGISKSYGNLVLNLPEFGGSSGGKSNFSFFLFLLDFDFLPDLVH